MTPPPVGTFRVGQMAREIVCEPVGVVAVSPATTRAPIPTATA